MKIHQFRPDGTRQQVGTFRSLVAFADWLDEGGASRHGEYYSVPPNLTQPKGIDRIVYDGTCYSDRHGNI